MKKQILRRAFGGFLAAAILASLCLPALADNEADADALEQQLIQELLDAGLDPDANPQQENSWRYENGELIEEESAEEETGLQESDEWQLQAENGISAFSLSGKIYGGIDVSHHQNQIDWNSLKGQIDYAIPRCGYGLNLQKQDDRCWYENASACQRLGIPFGTYIYSYATNTAMAKSEAEHALRLVQGYDLDYPIYLDIEDKTMQGLSAGELAAIAKTFCDIIEQAGYTPGVYASRNWWRDKLTDPVFYNSGWSRWIAHWTTGLDYSRSGYDMWQFGTAYVNGRAFDGNQGYIDPMTRGTGDINEDGSSDLRDVLLISTILSGRMDTTNRQRRAADMDKNASLNTSDTDVLVNRLLG